MDTQLIDVVIRCRPDMPLLERMLGRLRRQRDCAARITLLDLGASKASRALAEAHGLRIIDATTARFSPGTSMNQAMRATTSNVVAFVNADAVPVSETSLASLVALFESTPLLAAAFGRQVARRAAPSTSVRELRLDGPAASRNGGAFSMAAAVIHRRAWCRHAFDERLRYAEDLDWTTRVRRDGWVTSYVRGALFEQSDDSVLRQHFARPARPTPPPQIRIGDLASRWSAVRGADSGGEATNAAGDPAPRRLDWRRIM